MPTLTTDRNGPLQMLADEVSVRRNQCAAELLRGFTQTSEQVRGALKALASSIDPATPGHAALLAAVGLVKPGGGEKSPTIRLVDPTIGSSLLTANLASNLAFDQIDANHDGVIDRGEFTLGRCSRDPSPGSGLAAPVLVPQAQNLQHLQHLGPHYDECKDSMRRQFDAAQGLWEQPAPSSVLQQNRVQQQQALPTGLSDKRSSQAQQVALHDPKMEAVAARVTAEHASARHQHTQSTASKQDPPAGLGHVDAVGAAVLEKRGGAILTPF